MKNPIVIFILGFIIGAIIIYFLFGSKGTDTPPSGARTIDSMQADIKSSEEYSNPDTNSFLEPHAFFTSHRSKMEDSTNLFAGIKIDRNIIDSLVKFSSSKSNYYIAFGLDSGIVQDGKLSNRQKRLYIACEPDSGGVWQNSHPDDNIWRIAYNNIGKQILERVETHSYSNIAYYKEPPRKDDLFNKIFKYTMFVSEANAGTVCQCPTCGCPRAQGTNLKPGN